MATLYELYSYAERLRDARYKGVRSVRDSSGEQIEWRSDRELAATLAAVEAEIAALTRLRPSTTYLNTSKGL